jgi:biotin carboxyl carrier protein
MKTLLRISGQKIQSPESFDAGWTFEVRPGGWVLASRSRDDGSVERKRFFYSRERKRFFAKFTDGISHDFYGERVEQSRGSSASDSASDYTAQFPGKVRKILVKETEIVTAGTALLMVEAMKMEFAVKAGTSGKVVRIHVEEGAILAPGQKLLDFEEGKHE